MIADRGRLHRLWCARGTRRSAFRATLIVALVLVITLVISLNLAAGHAYGSALWQVTVVSPADISTPTATPTKTPVPTPTSLLPTPTPSTIVIGNLPSRIAGLEETVRTYTVKASDTLWDVAIESGLDLEEVFCAVAPDFRRDQPLVVGNVLALPPPGYLCHEVQPDETLASIASEYALSVQALIDVHWNELDPSLVDDAVLTAGRFLQIPPPSHGPDDGALLMALLEMPTEMGFSSTFAGIGTRQARPRVSVPDNWPYGSGYFEWPAYGWLSQGYHARHRALDIAAPPGSPVTAADRGEVVRAGWNDQGYGIFVVIDHHIDYLTLYAHLDELYVREGQIVSQGEVLGTVGSTGNSTGPHLHFEVRDFGLLADPLALLLR